MNRIYVLKYIISSVYEKTGYDRIPKFKIFFIPINLQKFPGYYRKLMMFCDCFSWANIGNFDSLKDVLFILLITKIVQKGMNCVLSLLIA